MAQEVDLDNERPAKKARLAKLSSPSPSAMSDAAYDDEDDLYDSSAMPLSSSGSSRHEKSNLKAWDSQPTGQLGALTIPGLGLQATPDPESIPQYPAFSSQNGISKNDALQLSPSGEDLEVETHPAVIGSINLPGLVEGKNSESLPRRSSSTKSLCLNDPSQLIGEKNSKISGVAQIDDKFIEAADGNKGKIAAEWQYDTSDAEAAKSSTSDSSDESDEDGFQMLNAEEQARLLMLEGGGSDDDNATKSGKGTGNRIRTANERPDEIIEIPDVEVTPDMDICELGTAENIVENYVLVKGTISGETKVLDSGSVLCLDDRSVIGVVSEPLGRVEEPHYSVAFTNTAAIQHSGIAIGTKVFYVTNYATYVFTQPLKNIKGSDASNLHDEEVGADEIEFSDDEAEAEHKRNLKQERQKKKSMAPLSTSQSGQGIRGAANQYRENSQAVSHSMSYDDEEVDDLYTPLRRPPNLHEQRMPDRLPMENRRARNHTKLRGERNRKDRNGRSRRGAQTGQKFKGRQGSPNQGQDIWSQRNSSQASFSKQAVLQHAEPDRASPFHSANDLSNSYLPNSNLYHPGQPFQSYTGQLAPQQQMWNQNAYGMLPSPGSFPQHPSSSHSPLSPSGSIPPGAFVNPAFFWNQPQPQIYHANSAPANRVYSPQSSQFPHQPHDATHRANPRSPAQRTAISPLASSGNMGRDRSPESDAAFQLAQEKLNIIRELQKK